MPWFFQTEQQKKADAVVNPFFLMNRLEQITDLLITLGKHIPNLVFFVKGAVVSFLSCQQRADTSLGHGSAIVSI
ncbi:hypothetical protein ScFU129_04090 [Streptococcus canis]|nr:hypothetical protein ScFU129_04090 [Streptococcus canis]